MPNPFNCALWVRCVLHQRSQSMRCAWANVSYSFIHFYAVYVSRPLHHQVTDFEDASAPFILYNSTRLTSLVNKFEARVKAGEIPPPPSLEDADFSQLDNNVEWALLLDHVLMFSATLKMAACSALPEPPGLPDYGTHKVRALPLAAF